MEIRQSGNVHTQAPEKSIVYDPNDVARTTEETNIHNTVTGNMHQQGPSKLTVYDPNDIAKTTIKETNIHNVRTGNVNISNIDKNLVMY